MLLLRLPFFTRISHIKIIRLSRLGRNRRFEEQSAGEPTGRDVLTLETQPIHGMRNTARRHVQIRARKDFTGCSLSHIHQPDGNTIEPRRFFTRPCCVDTLFLESQSLHIASNSSDRCRLLIAFKMEIIVPSRTCTIKHGTG